MSRERENETKQWAYLERWIPSGCPTVRVTQVSLPTLPRVPKRRVVLPSSV
jgi:hypothetical protein